MHEGRGEHRIRRLEISSSWGCSSCAHLAPAFRVALLLTRHGRSNSIWGNSTTTGCAALPTAKSPYRTNSPYRTPTHARRRLRPLIEPSSLCRVHPGEWEQASKSVCVSALPDRTIAASCGVWQNCLTSNESSSATLNRRPQPTQRGRASSRALIHTDSRRCLRSRGRSPSRTSIGPYHQKQCLRQRLMGFAPENPAVSTTEWAHAVFNPAHHPVGSAGLVLPRLPAHRTAEADFGQSHIQFASRFWVH